MEDLERALDAPLHVLYMKQLCLLRERALRAFKQALTSEGTEFEAMMQADELFRKEALDCTRQSPDWSYAKEATLFKAALLEVAAKAKKLQDLKLSAAKQNQQAMEYLRMQQQQLQAIQQQVSVSCASLLPRIYKNSGSSLLLLLIGCELSLERSDGLSHP